MVFVIITLLIFAVLNLYVALRVKKYINLWIKNTYFNVGYAVFWLALILCVLYGLYNGNLFGRVFSVYMAVFIYLIMAAAVIDIIGIIFKNVSKKKLSAAACFVVAATLVYGFINARTIKTVNYDVAIDKNTDNLKIVHISDTHYGLNEGVSMAKQMVEKINKQNPDIVLYTGDVFDGKYNLVSNPDEIAEVLSQIDSKYGVYACWGNHDAYGVSYDEMRQFLDKANITLLEDDYTLIDDEFYVVGRYDSDNLTDKKEIEDIVSSLDKSKPIFVMDHRPKDIEQASQSGVDLLLSGHTHNGQTFPGNIFINSFWENAYGLKEFGDMTSIVTSGVGLWGPPIRVGTNSEIAIINISGY